LISWSLDVLERAGCSPVIVVAPADLLDEARALVSHATTSVVVTGGDSRHASIARGLDEVRAERVVVHDAARPLVEPSLFTRVVAALEHSDCAIAAARVVDTIKEADEAGVVVATHDRSRLWAVQTPQAFRREALEAALSVDAAILARATDDAWLVERAGGTVRIVESSPENFKVTTPHDLAVADRLLGERALG